ncbi:hypothetical protein MMC07_002588 [Pseudocyphellaria aurata]|nr:hypothetical protein [Pseudocyphellaria aurata]
MEDILSSPRSSPKPMNIYIVGAQSTGKTTLVKGLQEYLSLHENCKWQDEQTSAPKVIIEVARGVLRDYAFTAEDITSSPTRAIELQRLILEAQLQAEAEVGDAWFISDRSGFDPVIYALRYVGTDAARELMASKTFVALQERMQRSLVIICEAGADWLFDDGVRLMPNDKEDWVAFHSLFCASLEAAGVEYFVLPHSVTGSTERVKFVIEKWAADHEQSKI